MFVSNAKLAESAVFIIDERGFYPMNHRENNQKNDNCRNQSVFKHFLYITNVLFLKETYGFL